MDHSSLKFFLISSCAFLISILLPIIASSSSLDPREEESQRTQALILMPLGVEKEQEEKEQSRNRLAERRKCYQQPRAKQPRVEVGQVNDLTSRENTGMTFPPVLFGSRALSTGQVYTLSQIQPVTSQEENMRSFNASNSLEKLSYLPSRGEPERSLFPQTLPTEQVRNISFPITHANTSNLGSSKDMSILEHVQRVSKLSSVIMGQASSSLQEATFFLELAMDCQAHPEIRASAKLIFALMKQALAPQQAEALLKEVIDCQACPLTQAEAKLHLAILKKHSNPLEAEILLQGIIKNREIVQKTRARAMAVLGFLITERNLFYRQRYEGITFLVIALGDKDLPEYDKQLIRNYLNKY